MGYENTTGCTHNPEVVGLGADAPLPVEVLRSRYCWTARAEDEVAIVCDSRLPVKGLKTSAPWSCLKVLGPLALDQAGILAALTAALAGAGVAVLVLSTYDTDYLLVRSENLYRAIQALRAAGHSVASPDSRESSSPGREAARQQ